jgi:hypothetical protein
MNRDSINEEDLRDFVRRLGHEQAGGCSEWVLVDPRSQEVRATGIFTDVDMLIMALPMYVEMYNIQVCRNPRPLSVLMGGAPRNQFNRTVQKVTALEQIEMLTQVVLTLKPKNKNTPETIAAAACNLMVRLGFGKYSVEQAGPYLYMRMPLSPTPLRKFGSPESARILFGKFEDTFRDAMTADEKDHFEILPRSGPELFDPPIGISQISGNLQLPGRRLYAPAEAPDPALEQMLTDLQAGKPLAHQAKAAASASIGMPRLEGLVTEWEDHTNFSEERFEEGTGILPKGAQLKIESDEGKLAKGQIEAFETVARDSYQRRVKHLWHLPWTSKSLSAKLGGGSRPGEVSLITGTSYKLVQDYLAMSLENLLRQAEILGFFASTRLGPGDFWARTLERHTAKVIEEIEGISQPGNAASALTQLRSQFKRAPLVTLVSTEQTLAGLAKEVRSLRESDEALAALPGLLVLDGFDDFSHGSASATALRELRALSRDSHMAIWLGCAGDAAIDASLVDLHARMVTGEEPLVKWVNSLPDFDPEKSLAQQVLPRLLPEIANGRQASILHATAPAAGWSMVAWQLYYPQTGRFQNIAPRKEG